MFTHVLQKFALVLKLLKAYSVKGIRTIYIGLFRYNDFYLKMLVYPV